MRIQAGIINCFLIFLAVFFSMQPQLQAAEYYVDQNHPKANDVNAGSIDSPWKTITKANQVLVAGDTVYIRAGSYNSYIAPNNSGTSSGRITYQNFGTDTVTISNTNYAVYLDGKDYISVQGINATNCRHFLYIVNAANYNIIAYCNFNIQDPPAWDSSWIYGSSQYNWIHHCIFSKAGECSIGGDDIGSVLNIGNEESDTDQSWYNLVENCTFFHGGHHVLGLESGFCTVRNNYFYNDAWTRSKGNRNLYMVGYASVTGNNLVEGNRFGYAAAPCDAPTVGNVAMSTQYNLFRYNKLYHSNAYNFATYGYSGYSNGSYNRIYNNTIFNSGYGINVDNKHGTEDTAINFMHSSNTGNIVKNNLFFSNYQIFTGYTNNQIIAKNFNGDIQGDPRFVNASTTPPSDKSDSNLPNLDLQAGSPAIDAGEGLTSVSSADIGTGTSLLVSDARYFQDGKYAPIGRVFADWIAVGNVNNIVQIASINYTTNTIALTNSITRNNADPTLVI